MLICRPVSPRSEPRKIRKWIQQMEEKRARHRDDPEACRVIDTCIAQASDWLNARIA